MFETLKDHYEMYGFQIPHYMMAPLNEYIRHGRATGGFLAALLSNDLARTIQRADDDNARNLPAYMYYLWNNAPQECFGSPEKFSAWRDPDNPTRKEYYRLNRIDRRAPARSYGGSDV